MFIAAVLFSVFFVFFSCSNLFDDINVASPASSETVTITGTFGMSGRMAMPSNSFAATQYTVTATAPTFLGTVEGNANSTNKTFSIALPVGYKWTITIVMEVKESETDTEFKTIFQGSYTFTDELTAAYVTTPVTVVLAPLSGGYGTIKLPVSVASGVSVATVVISGLSDSPETYTLSDGTYTINKQGVPSGAYTVTIDFKNTAGLIIYSNTQTINVLSNMTTTRWVSNGSSSPINGDGNFVVTESLVQAFATSQIYVGANPYQMHEPSDTNLGTPYAPLATVGEAIRRLSDSSKDYTIRISGEKVGPITLGVSDDTPYFAARSVTLCGMTENMTDILTVSGVATILTITTTAPVTIRKLKISSGHNTSENSAGINMEAGSKLILDDGALITMNSGYMKGAGIYATGENTEIVMNSGSKVSGNLLTYEGEQYDNGGAGIYISGSGITDTSKLPKLTINTGAEISDNTATAFCRGGGIYADNAIVSINGGKITGNKAGDCAGNIYVVGSDSSLTMTAGEISDGEVNSGASYGSYGDDAYGGGVVLFGGTFEMSGGKICNNKAIPDSSGRGYGGGISMGGATFIMTGGEISGNSIEGTNIKAGAINFEDTNAVFKIGGSAYIPYGVNGETGAGKNDIYVGANKKIKVISALTRTSPVATITPATRSDGLAVLARDENVTSADFAAACGKFAVTGVPYFVDSEGKLKAGMIATSSNAASVVGSITTQGTTLVAVTGNITEGEINSIKSAIDGLSEGVLVSLDLSGTTLNGNGENINFDGCKKIETIVLPSGMTSLKSEIFYNCSNLKSVTLPEGLTTIGEMAFVGSGIQSINIPNSVTKIEKQAFNQCHSLETVAIPSSVTTIGDKVFYVCHGLKTVIFECPASSLTIGVQAFDDTPLENKYFIGTEEQKNSKLSINSNNGKLNGLTWSYLDYTQLSVGTNGTYVLFGEFPQTIKASSVTIDGTTTKTAGTYTYYKGSDGAWYARQAENGKADGYTYSDGTTVAQGGTSYKYFKVEPIKWRVLTTNYNGKKLLLAEDILINSSYYDENEERTIDGVAVYPNNYKESRVRAYLNGLEYNKSGSTNSDFSGKGFLQTAFTSNLQDDIATTTVYNNLDSTGESSNPYVCADTEDKVFLLSYKDATDYDLDKPSRVRVPTDFAKANGARIEDGSDYWWLRSPSAAYATAACDVYTSGEVYGGYIFYDGVTLEDWGVVPALCLTNEVLLQNFISNFWGALHN